MSRSNSHPTNSQSEDPPETRSTLPVQLSNLQRNTQYVSPYAPVGPSSSSSSQPSASSRTPVNKDSKMSGKGISSADKAKMIKSLKAHSVNTLLELRRIEKLLTPSGKPVGDVNEALTGAWAHYVNSNNLISELRALTKSYPFSSECLDEAKWMVISDASSARSWNYCWLVLQKVRNQNLITKHARQQASKPVMWGGKTPTGAQVSQLATACTNEWTRALNQLLRHWDTPPMN